MGQHAKQGKNLSRASNVDGLPASLSHLSCLSIGQVQGQAGNQDTTHPTTSRTTNPDRDNINQSEP